jgi:plastocyanin
VRRAVAAGAAVAATALAPAAASAATAQVTMPGTRFTPSVVQLVPGDGVVWTNRDTRTHTVTADDGTFDSAGIAPGTTYSRVFATAGRYAYFCSIHRFMRGEVDVSALLLAASTAHPASGQPVTLSGRAGTGVAAVTVEQAAGAAWTPLGTAPTGANGAFAFVVHPAGRATYRVTAGADVSAAVAVEPIDLAARLTARYRRGRGFLLTARVAPAQPGGRVAFQRYVPELFAWQTFARRRLGAASTVAVSLRVRYRTLVRVVFPVQPGRPGPARSRPVAIGRGSPFG